MIKVKCLKHTTWLAISPQAAAGPTPSGEGPRTRTIVGTAEASPLVKYSIVLDKGGRGAVRQEADSRRNVPGKPGDCIEQELAAGKMVIPQAAGASFSSYARFYVHCKVWAIRLSRWPRGRSAGGGGAIATKKCCLAKSSCRCWR